MKTYLAYASALVLVVGCGAGGGSGAPANTGGASGGVGGSAAGGSAGGGGVVANGGSAAGNASAGGTSGGVSGSASGGSASGGSASGGSAGAAGGTGGGAAGFSCPPGPFPAPVLSGTPTRIPGVPPSDSFNNTNFDFTNVEGALWHEGALYVSEIKGNNQPPSRVLKVDAAGTVTIPIPDSASNGLAINAAGELFGALHGKPGTGGSVSKLSLTGGVAVPLVSQFETKNFNSPNDLAIHSTGTIYFSDPEWQAPSPAPQGGGNTRVYRIPPGGQAVAIESLNAPNGVTLSPAQDWLYVSGGQLRKYPVSPDGTVGGGTNFLPGGGGGGDGMVVDCAGNLYVTENKEVKVYTKDGAPLGSITVSAIGSSVTNVAFGGPQRTTLYITGQGAGEMQKGVFTLELNVPGFPY